MIEEHQELREGPIHYEGWTCRGCKHRTYEKEYGVWRCSKSHEILHAIMNLETPASCPYLKHAIIMHVMEEYS